MLDYQFIIMSLVRLLLFNFCLQFIVILIRNIGIQQKRHCNLAIVYLVVHNNLAQWIHQENLGNYLIHRRIQFDILHQNHNHLHLQHKDYQLYKNVHHQQLVDNNNQLLSQNQVKLDNCLIHKQDYLDTLHEHHNLLHLLHKFYNNRIQFLHCLQWHS